MSVKETHRINLILSIKWAAALLFYWDCDLCGSHCDLFKDRGRLVVTFWLVNYDLRKQEENVI